MALESIPAGSSYVFEINKAIKGCEIFLLLLSYKSQESTFVEREIDAAISSRKNIIAFQIEECELNE